ncbi:MAG: hypothetical protein V4649_15200 [Bacteroidota bacterium]
MTKLVAVCFLFASLSHACAQDVDLVQPINSPVILNPAMTGLIPGSYRAVAVHDQYLYNGSISAASVDLCLLKDKGYPGDAVGVGVAVSGDRFNHASPRQALISVAYHKSIGVKNQHHLSLGIQGAAIWMYNDYYSKNRRFFNYYDANFGLTYSAILSPKWAAFAGVAIYGISTPAIEHTISTAQVGSTISQSRSAHAGAVFAIDNLTTLYMAACSYQSVINGDRLLFSSYVGRQLNPGQPIEKKQTTLYAGLTMRVADLGPYIAIERWNCRLGISYTDRMNDFFDFFPDAGTWAVSLQLFGATGRRATNWHCPSFY